MMAVVTFLPVTPWAQAAATFRSSLGLPPFWPVFFRYHWCWNRGSVGSVACCNNIAKKEFRSWNHLSLNQKSYRSHLKWNVGIVGYKMEAICLIQEESVKSCVGPLGSKKLILPLKHVLDPRPSFPLWEGCIRACCSDVWMHAGCVWSSPRRERHGGHSKGPGPSPWTPHPPSHHSHPLRLVPAEIFSLILITPDSGFYFLRAIVASVSKRWFRMSYDPLVSPGKTEYPDCFLPDAGRPMATFCYCWCRFPGVLAMPGGPRNASHVWTRIAGRHGLSVAREKIVLISMRSKCVARDCHELELNCFQETYVWISFELSDMSDTSFCSCMR